MDETGKVRYTILMIYRGGTGKNKTYLFNTKYDADGNLIKESSPTKEAVYAYNAANRMAESHITEIRGGSRQTPKDTVYSYDSFGRRILEADILNRWVRHTEYRGLSMEVWKNAAVHGIKEPRNSRGIDSTGMVFKNLNDFLPAFADFSRASPYDFTHVALTLPLGGAGGEVLGLLQTEHSGINFNPFVNASHTDAERHYFGKDHLGSVRAVTNQWGSPLYTFDYDVFGQPLQDRPERFRHGFTGKEYDSWTGLYNYGLRDYAPVLGRFTTVDPVQDGHNWYAYVNSDPVSWLDPWGLCPQDAESGEDTARNAETMGKAPAHWRDNGDGTWTAISEGATLWEVWGADSYAATGLTEEQARRIHVGDTFGKKIESTPVITDDIQRLLPVAETGLTLKPIETKVSLESSEKGYPRGTNIAVGVAEIISGVVVSAASIIAAGGIDVFSGGTATIISEWAVLGGWATGSTLAAYGITRLTGANNGKFTDDIKGTFIPPVVDIAEGMDKASEDIQE